MLIFLPLFWLIDLLGIDMHAFVDFLGKNEESIFKLLMPLRDFLWSYWGS